MPTPSLLIVPARFKTGKMYSQIPTSGDGDFTVTRNTTATRLNDAGAIESVASGIPRLDYSVSGFVTGCPALLVEPAATNQIRNNSNAGAVTGTPGGTLPTNWTEALVGLTRSVIALGTENGVPYIDVRLSGTANASAASLNFESTTQIVATSGQVWTNSVYLKSIAAPNPYANVRVGMIDRTSGGVFIATGQGSDLTLTSTLNRFSLTRALSSGSTVARVQPNVVFNLVSGTAYDFTVRIGYPQMELGSVATSVIPTTAGTGSRSADVISVSGAVSGSIGQTAGTAYLEIVAVSGTNSGRVLSLTESGAPTNNRIAFTIDASNHRLEVIVRSSGSITNGSIGSSAATLLVNGVNKIAYAYDGVAGSNALAINGSVVATNSQTLAFTQALSRVNVAILESDLTVATNQRIRAVALYTTRLTNAELATLTTP
jgi:hypothetical protein